VREDDGRKLNHKTLEEMRLRAVAAGQHPEDVAATLGMARSTVFDWIARYREGGKQALKARPVPGRPPKLSGQQLRTLYSWSPVWIRGSCSSSSRCGCGR
jgi:transposase